MLGYEGDVPEKINIVLEYCKGGAVWVSSVASCKHYTADVVVAWYTVNLVVFYVDKKLSELPDRTNGNSPILLPLSMKDKDSWNKEENHKLLTGNSVDPANRKGKGDMEAQIDQLLNVKKQMRIAVSR